MDIAVLILPEALYRVLKTAGVTNNGNSAVTGCYHLRKTAGLVTGGNNENIRCRIKLFCKVSVVLDKRPYSVVILSVKVAETLSPSSFCKFALCFCLPPILFAVKWVEIAGSVQGL